jgi:mRNA guanylyltransferase
LKWKPPHENSVDFKLELKFPELGDSSQPDLYAKPYFPLYVFEGGGRYRFYDILSVGHDAWGRYVLLVPDPIMIPGTVFSRAKIYKKQYDDRIVEARWDFEQQAWRLMGIRDDKRGANHISVVESIIRQLSSQFIRKMCVCSFGFYPFASLAAPLLCRVPANRTLTQYCGL